MHLNGKAWALTSGATDIWQKNAPDLLFVDRLWPMPMRQTVMFPEIPEIALAPTSTIGDL